MRNVAVPSVDRLGTFEARLYSLRAKFAYVSFMFPQGDKKKSGEQARLVGVTSPSQRQQEVKGVSLHLVSFSHVGLADSPCTSVYSLR